jgi:hypothetical protein
MMKNNKLPGTEASGPPAAPNTLTPSLQTLRQANPVEENRRKEVRTD